MDLHVERIGQGKSVVMLHSGGGDSRDWTFLAPLLSEHYQVIMVDARGCGQSPAPIGPANYVADLLELLDELQLEKATLLGLQVGGQIATEFALQHSERVQELVLLTPELANFRHASDICIYHRTVMEALPDVAHMVELAMEAPFFPVIKNSPHFDFMKTINLHNTHRLMEWAASGPPIWPTIPAIEHLNELEPRTLHIHGTLDHPDSKKIAEQYEVAQHIQFATIVGADQKLNFTHPEELAELIVSFLKE
ncbi:alpha/beta hydrolase [Paenibacillus sp. N1-5-1-14]|uniref:alpha/beta fold hydrolase n=1 Tax=Paenibacillus radicibacter TaxID=2972488 RepID=UPI002158B49A|nr:alpha/beta hydrolase [Paenibacillus radicibacter]MCR8644265.1 alpha/beta hydrolase [Paenibacillus radicibacter]